VQNPFKPTAGATPPELVGRAGLLDEFEYGLQQGSGAPGLLTIITGSRGIGKTVMLSAAEDIARAQGWAVISRTATPGFLARVGDDMLRLLEELRDGPPARKITAFSAAGFGLTTQLPPERAVDWRRTGNELLRVLDSKGTGLVITVDEIQRNTLVVAESALSEISDRDHQFLDAMATQDGPSAAGQIGAVLSVPSKVGPLQMSLARQAGIQSPAPRFSVRINGIHRHTPNQILSSYMRESSLWAFQKGCKAGVEASPFNARKHVGPNAGPLSWMGSTVKRRLATAEHPISSLTPTS